MSGDIYGIAIEALVKESRGKSKMIVGLMSLLAVSIGLNAAQWNYLPEPKVVSETEDGRIRPLPTLDQPIFESSQVLNWTAEKAELLYDLPFTEISAYPAKLAQYLMPETRDQFLAGLTQAGIIEKVKVERRILRAVRSAPPTLLNEYVKAGRYIWEVELPLTLIYEGAKDTQRDHVIVTVAVGREHLMRVKDGLVIGRLSIKPGKGV